MQFRAKTELTSFSLGMLGGILGKMFGLKRLACPFICKFLPMICVHKSLIEGRVLIMLGHVSSEGSFKRSILEYSLIGNFLKLRA